MYFLLNKSIALRSWWRVPHAYYLKNVRNAKKLSAEEFEILSQCDSNHDIPETEITRELMQKGFISSCQKGEGALASWQIRNCNNRYFPAMNWMITGKCNYNCLHCFNASDNNALMSEFTLEEAEQLLDEAEECGIHALTITGGEPMCHRNFFEILEGIYKRGMFVEELNTNGFYINDETLRRLKELGCEPLIKISFDGLGHHDWLRNRKGAEADAIRAIELCVKNGFRVKVQTNVHRRNVDAMLPTVRFLDSLGVCETRIIRTTEAPRWTQNASGATMELTEYYDRMLELVSAYSREAHIMNIDVWQFLSLFPIQKTYRMRPVECGMDQYRDSLPVCRGNRGMVAISANGNVFPCMQMSGYYEARNDILGNVKQTGLQTLLQAGKYLSEICTTVGELSTINKVCGDCRYFKHCVGGCRAIALALTGDKMGVDPAKCLFYQGGYPAKIADALREWRDLLPINV